MANKMIIIAAALATLIGASALATTTEDCRSASFNQSQSRDVYAKLYKAEINAVNSPDVAPYLGMDKNLGIRVHSCTLATIQRDDGTTETQVNADLWIVHVKNGSQVKGTDQQGIDQPVKINGDASQATFTQKFTDAETQMVQQLPSNS